jgi:hypothetical protein
MARFNVRLGNPHSKLLLTSVLLGISVMQAPANIF